MNSEVERIFHLVADLTPEQRARYFEEHGVREEQRRELESLLHFDSGSTEYLANQLLTSADVTLEGESARCGAWLLTKRLEGGGMGTVYLATRDDGEVRQQAAVKLVHAGGADLRSRFLRERQILASLNHANIARLLDAGHRSDGQPFLVMEYVDGVRIDVYAEKIGLTEKIRLFLKVCDAVAHAHRNLVIHRDLKPPNILITEGGEPKLLDFGIAKVLDAPDSTQTVERFLTPDYSSPEQVRGGVIGTSADVYSLGAVLYRLLAGVSPHQPPAMAAGMNWEKAVLEQQPKALSEIRRDVPHDLDYIVLKALRKEPEERYGSVEQLAEDLLAFLESRPVRARAAGGWYLTRKFLERHKAPVAAVAAVFVVLAGGIVASTRQATRAAQAETAALMARDVAKEAQGSALVERDRAAAAETSVAKERDRAVAAERKAVAERDRAIAEKQRADTEAANAKAISGFLQYDLLAQASPNAQATPNTKPDPDLKVRTALDRSAKKMAGRFPNQPVVEATLRFTIGRTYRELGLYKEAQQEIERAVELTQKALGEEHTYTLSSMMELASLHELQGRMDEAEALFVKLLEVRRRLLGPEHEEVLTAVNNLALLYTNQGKYGLAEPLQTQVLEVRRRVVGEEHARTQVNMVNLAITYGAQGKYEESEALHSKVLAIRRRLLGNEHPNTLNSIRNLASTYFYEGKLEESEGLLRGLMEVQQRVRGERHPDTLIAVQSLARVLAAERRYDEAEPLYRKALEGRRRSLGNEHPDTATSLALLGMLQLERQKYNEAEPVLREALQIFEKRNASDWNRYRAQVLLGASLSGQKRYQDAETLLVSGYQGVTRNVQKIPLSERQIQEYAVQSLARLYQEWGKTEMAVEWRSKLRR